MTTDYRDLITRMAKELDEYRQLLLDDRTVTHRLSNEARAVLARRGNPAPPPADGEVAEVMGLFRHWAEAYPDSVTVDPYWLTRAADLLQRLSPPQPEVGE